MNTSIPNCCRLIIVLMALECGRAWAGEPVSVSVEAEAKPSTSLWLESSLKRVFPNTEPGSAKLELLAPRNGTVSFQACVRTNRTAPLRVDGQLEGAEGVESRVRLVGLVPMPHFTQGTAASELDGVGSLPGLAPDPL